MDDFGVVLERFDSLIKPFDKLIACIADKTFLPRHELTDAREQFKSIKETLNTVYKDLQRQQLNELERRFFVPAVAKARTKLHARWNSNPFTSRWFDQLYDSRDDLNHMRFELERFRDKAS